MVLKQIEELKSENKMLRTSLESTTKKVLSLENIKEDPAAMKYYTGFVNFGTFMALFNFLEARKERSPYCFTPGRLFHLNKE